MKLALLLAVFLVSGSEAQQSRFNSLTSCLQNNNLSCVSCDVLITVDSTTGANCRPMMQQGSLSLHNTVCNELDDVLQSIATMDTRHDPGGCIKVLLQPTASGDPYFIAEDPNRMIEQSVVIQASEEVVVSFSPPPDLVGSEGVPYALVFREGDLVGVSGVRFQEATGRIAVEEVDVFVLERSSFEYFTSGAVDVYNTHTVLVSEAVFRSNGPFSAPTLMEYRGDSAGLSVALDRNALPGNRPPLQLHIENSVFLNNTASSSDTTNTTVTTAATQEPPPDNNNNNNNNDDGNNNNNNKRSKGEEFDAIGGVVVSLQFTARGGGLAVIVNDEDPADVVIRDCQFSDNEALAFGGGMYVGLDGRSQHSVIINNTVFTDNSSPSTGGALQLTFLKEGMPGSDNKVLIVDSEFYGNQAQYGGAVFFLPIDIDLARVEGDSEIGVLVQVQECLFSGNHADEVGSAFGSAFHILAFNTKPLEFIDCVFEDNTVGGVGVVSTAFYPLSFIGSNKFINNRGASLNVVGSRVRIYGNLEIRGNDNYQGGIQDHGGLYVTSQGQLELKSGASISFVNNVGITGAGLNVEAPHVPSLFSQLPENPLCVLLFEDPLVPPDQWHTKNVSVDFVGNEAVVSSAVYINNLDLCSWTSSSSPFFNREQVFFWPFVNLTNNVNDGHGGSTDPKWAVQTPAVSVSVNRNEFEVFPGQRINLRMSGRDELGQRTTLTTRISDASNEGSLLQIVPSSVSLNHVQEVPTIVFYKPGDQDKIVSREIRAESIIKPNRRTVARDTFTVTSRSCPAGLTDIDAVDYPGHTLCFCDLERDDIVTCAGRLIILSTHRWGIATRTEGPSNALTTYPCPSGYCDCVVQDLSGQLECTFVYDEFFQDEQCNCNRTGVLCGSCPEGYGVSPLLNECVSCSSLYLLLIPLLALVDTVVIVALLLFMKPIPIWLYPVLCYIQILPQYTQFFPVTFELVRPVLLFVSSATGLYFPYDFCLSSELDSVGSFSLRYLPPLLALVTSVIVILIRSKMMRPCCWHGVWWLVVLLYTPALHTALSTLNCPVLPSEDEPSVPRWFLNGDIKCFHGAHIPLGIAAIAVLFVCLSLIPLCIAISLEKLKFPRWLRFLVNPLTHPYKEEFKWWSGIELLKRMILVLFSITFPGNDYAIIMVLMVVLTVSSFCKPYKHLIVNILDLFLACDILVLLLLQNTAYFGDTLQEIDSSIIRVNSSLATNCGSNFSGVTPMVALLTPFYYIPLATAVCCLVVWLVYLLYMYKRSMIGLTNSKENAKQVNNDLCESLPAVAATNRRYTQSVVDVIEMEQEETGGLSVQPLKLSHKLSLQPRDNDNTSKRRQLELTTTV